MNMEDATNDMLRGEIDGENGKKSAFPY